MVQKQQKLVKLCLILLSVSMAVMAISTVVQIIHNGWGSVHAVNIVPFCGMAVVLITLLSNDKKKDGE